MQTCNAQGMGIANAANKQAVITPARPVSLQPPASCRAASVSEHPNANQADGLRWRSRSRRCNLRCCSHDSLVTSLRADCAARTPQPVRTPLHGAHPRRKAALWQPGLALTPLATFPAHRSGTSWPNLLNRALRPASAAVCDQTSLAGQVAFPNSAPLRSSDAAGALQREHRRRTRAAGLPGAGGARARCGRCSCRWEAAPAGKHA